MIYKIITGVLIFFVLNINVNSEENNISNIVKKLNINSKVADLNILLVDPIKSVSLILQELEPVDEIKITAIEEKNKAKEMHVIWCVRALRFLTGLEFSAPTSYKFAGKDDIRRYNFIKADNSSVKFFSVWMSRGTVYLAPLDAQELIITKWKEWFKKDGQTHAYKAAESYSDWYF